jgi:hypothetical protein
VSSLRSGQAAFVLLALINVANRFRDAVVANCDAQLSAPAGFD